jgi:glycosyltransferase involved in cell wall biosynthesis
MKPKRRLVAGLICGNEEERIERCVKSLQQICDDIVIVRAIGSLEPDKTIEIAKGLGCHCFEYFNQPLVSDWKHLDDFGRARNFAFEKAYDLSGNDGWVMWADCDDVIEPEMAEPHLKAIAECPDDHDWILTDYVIPEQNKRSPRERFFRFKTGWWYRPIHENVQPSKDVKVNIRRDLEIVHKPAQGNRNSNERNMRILMHNDKMSSHYKFYLHYENFIFGKNELAAKYGAEALAMQDLDGVHRYEILLNCANLTSGEVALNFVKQAKTLEPKRREAYGLEASILLDLKKPYDALKVANEMTEIPVPKFPQWTHRAEWYGWKGYQLLAWCLRSCGKEDQASIIESNVLKQSKGVKISLLHATRGRPIEAVKAMTMWFNRAKNPERIEHIFAVDKGDESAVILNRFKKVVQYYDGFSVGAWNLAADKCSGDILVQLSDDWECPIGWDEMIESRINPENESVLQISDGYRTDSLLCMAILTRKYYEKHGLFNPAFKNVYSDTDFTFRAAKNNAIVDGRDVTFIHHHPFWENRPLDPTYERGNNEGEYARAKEIFERLHPQK